MRFVTTGSLSWLSKKNQPPSRSGASNRAVIDCMCTRPETLLPRNGARFKRGRKHESSSFTKRIYTTLSFDESI